MTLTTERDMLNLLAERYTSIRPGTMTDRWVRAEHVRNRLGYAGSLTSIADFIALDKHPGIPYGSNMAMHWHEVKVSRADWLSELKQPEKSAAFTRYAHYSWLVVANKDIVKAGELPEGWGMLVANASGLRARVKASRREPEPMPLDLAISVASSAQRTGVRELGRRDAAITHLGSWERKCSICGGAAPCRWHQPRDWAEAEGLDRLDS